MSTLTPAEAEALRADLVIRMKALDARFPGEPSFQSIITQLMWLEPYLASDAPMPPRRPPFTFGLLGAKMLPEFDPDISPVMSRLSRYVDDHYGG
jgi:hypothetical protein